MFIIHLLDITALYNNLKGNTTDSLDQSQG